MIVVDSVLVPNPGSSAREVKFPGFEVGICTRSKQGTPDVFPEDAAILVLAYEVLFESGRKLIVASMRSDPDDTVPFMSFLAPFEYEVDPVTRDAAGVNGVPEGLEAPRESM